MNNHQRFTWMASQVESALEKRLNGGQGRLFEAMRYALLSAGKRVRPIILLEFCRLSGGQIEAAMPFACAIEMIHAYSLIHDDLPCMDDDDMRRGRPSCHCAFDEHTAVLAGDALLNLAFETMLDPAQTAEISCRRARAAAFAIAGASGALGMAGGQSLDMNRPDDLAPEQAVKRIHELKTGAMITAAARAGCILGGAGALRLKAAHLYARNLGLAFQIRDDLLDLMEGKTEKDKLTFPSLFGQTRCEAMVDELTFGAVKALDVFDDTGFLVWLAGMLAHREK